MSRPTEQELQIALERAGWLRENSQDDCFLAKSLLNHNYRIKFLEKVLKATKIYLQSGNGAHELGDLLKAIEQAEKVEYRPGEERHSDNKTVLL